MMMRKLFQSMVMLLLLAMALTIAPRALADDSNRASQVKVQVWPEYDKPSVLVLIEGTLADVGNLPRDVSVLIPSSATGIIATYENADGSLAAEQTYKTEKQDDGFVRVTFSTKSANYHLEYYDDLLRGAPDKTLDFLFKSPAPADKLSLEIQQPLQATNFVIVPSSSATRTEAGFTYFVSDYSAVSAGQLLRATVKYTKSDPNPSVVPSTAPAAVPATAPSTASSSGGWSSVYIVVGLVVLGCAAVLGWFMFQQRPHRPAPIPASSRRSRRGKPSRAAGSAFCTQCGRNLTSEDNFCPNCGARRRTH